MAKMNTQQPVQQYLQWVRSQVGDSISLVPVEALLESSGVIIIGGMVNLWFHMHRKNIAQRRSIEEALVRIIDGSSIPGFTTVDKSDLIAKPDVDSALFSKEDKSDSKRIHIKEALSNLPLYFIENQGQLHKDVCFYIQGSEKNVYFTPSGITLALKKKKYTRNEIAQLIGLTHSSQVYGNGSFLSEIEDHGGLIRDMNDGDEHNYCIINTKNAFRFFLKDDMVKRFAKIVKKEVESGRF